MSLIGEGPLLSAGWFPPYVRLHDEQWTGSVAQIEVARERERCCRAKVRPERRVFLAHLHGKAVVTRSVLRLVTEASWVGVLYLFGVSFLNEAARDTRGHP